MLAIYIAAGGATTGPFAAAELKRKVSSGELTGETYVWMEGMTEWKRAKEVAQLQDILAAARDVFREERSVTGWLMSEEVTQ